MGYSPVQLKQKEKKSFGFEGGEIENVPRRRMSPFKLMIFIDAEAFFCMEGFITRECCCLARSNIILKVSMLRNLLEGVTMYYQQWYPNNVLPYRLQHPHLICSVS